MAALVEFNHGLQFCGTSLSSCNRVRLLVASPNPFLEQSVRRKCRLYIICSHFPSAFPVGRILSSSKIFSWRQGVHYYQPATHLEEEDREGSDDEDGHQEDKPSALAANVDAWKAKLHAFIQNTPRQEIVSMDRKDRRDYLHLAVLAQQLGLYSQMYGKVVVFSKVPLPNYRPDLDQKRPVRKVNISPEIHTTVNTLLKTHLEQKQTFVNELMHSGISNGQLKGIPLSNLRADRPERIPVPERILRIRSKQLQDKQCAWQDSLEGQRMMALRTSLPAYKQREAFISALAMNQVLVVSGETGCGKTTQLPQYILESEIEAGRGASCSIICTQPRRISAMSVAERVAAERGESLGESVGYKVRLEGMRGRGTQLLFCTTGILLRRLLVDPLLGGVSHVLVDEIHERGMNEDFLLIILKDVLPRRPDLRLVLMSATLNAELFSKYFNNAPTCHIPGFTHPVKAHFLEDILELTGHRLTEYNQFDDYGQDKSWKRQKQLQSRKQKNSVNNLVEDAFARADFCQYSYPTQNSLFKWSPEGLGFNLIQALLCHIVKRERPGAVLVFMTGWEDINALKDLLSCHPLLGDETKVLVLPCHGGMASAEQKLIFKDPPPDVRKIVLATNMAETSITINDVVFVVDCGKAKETSYDALNNTPCLLPSWISKASARQRRGRAGRVQPGEAYHLYPKIVYDAFAEYQVPELHRMPLDALCLQIKSLKLGSIEGFLSKAMQPPNPLSVRNSIQLLKTIGALDDKEELTHLGHHLSMLPVEPMIGKMLVMGSIFGCLEPVLTIAAGLSLKDPFVSPFDKKTMAEQKRFEFGMKDCSDHIAYVRAYDGWQDARKTDTGMEYCWDNFLSVQTLESMHSLRRQFRDLIKQSGFTDRDGHVGQKYIESRGLLGGIICSALFPGVAAVLPRKNSTQFKTVEDGDVLLFQSSVFSKIQRIPYPWLVFNEKVKTGIVFIRDSTGISDSMLLLFGGRLEPGRQPGHLLMQDGCLEFYMRPELAQMILQLKDELANLICKKMGNPKLDIYEDSSFLMDAVLTLLHGDQNEGAFTFARSPKVVENVAAHNSSEDVKGVLHNQLQKEGQKLPRYEVKGPKKNLFQAQVRARGHYFIGKPATSKKQAERNAASKALEWLNRSRAHSNTLS